jgi:KDO2-lipid IV(A) lauroyltransferase
MNRIPFKTLRHALTVPAVKAVILVSVITPRWLSRINARILGLILAKLPLPSNRILEKHRQTVMKKNGISAGTADVYTSILTSFFDFFYLSYRSDSAFRKVVVVRGAENMAEALSHGKGVIAVTAHFSAWELAPRAIRLLGHDVAVVGRSLSQKDASEVLDRLRQKPGVITVDRDAGASPVLRLLRSNHTLGILIDQNTKGVQSEIVDFLGSPAPTPASPAILAGKLGIPVVTLHLTRRENSTYTLDIDRPVFFDRSVPVTEILGILNERISSWILNAPEQWVWFHDRWRL